MNETTGTSDSTTNQWCFVFSYYTKYKMTIGEMLVAAGRDLKIIGLQLAPPPREEE